MPRNKPRTSTKGTFTADQMKAALESVRNGSKVNAASKHFNIPFSTLKRYLKNTKDVQNLSEAQLKPNFASKLIFSSQLEDALVEYVLECSRMGYGLTPMDIRRFAFQYAVQNNVKFPEVWKTNEIAGEDWFRCFIKRHQNLSTRTPEACSVARAMCFNKPIIDNYFNKLEGVLQRNPDFANGKRVFNLDETGTTTVGEVNSKIVAEKGVKQLHQIKSAERGVLVTTCCIICANGSVVAPVMVFPRVNFADNMLINAYPGTKGLATKKGWMNADNFPHVIQHFIKETNSSKDNPALLILDNVSSHLTIAVIDLCRDNGVTLFTLPPHTTHKTQPLDVGVFGPFKSAYNKAYRSWTLNNPGKVCSIYNVAGLVNEAICTAGTPANIFSAFKATGIFPFNRNIFSDIEYLPSKVTVNPQPLAQQEDNQLLSEEKEDDPSATNSSAQSNFVTPRKIRPLPTAQPRNILNPPREKGKCRVATDSTEKNEILAKHEAKKKKEEELEGRRQERARKSLNKIIETMGKADKENSKPKGAKKRKSSAQNSKKKTAKRAKKLPSESESSGTTIIDLLREEEESTLENQHEDGVDIIPLDDIPEGPAAPEEGDHVLIEFQTGKEIKCYVAKVLKGEDEWCVLEVSYYRICSNITYKFTLPQVPDLKTVHRSNIKNILPKAIYGTTSRQRNFINFEFDFTPFRMG